MLAVAGPFETELRALEQSVDSEPASAAASRSIPADGLVPPIPAQKLLDAMQESIKARARRQGL